MFQCRFGERLSFFSQSEKLREVYSEDAKIKIQPNE